VRFLVALALLFSITPGMSEVVETAAHLIAHGDAPHHQSDADRECNEHLCTPLAHHCGCHATMFGQAGSRRVDLAALHGMRKIDPAALAAVLGRVSEPPPLRPPIA
jgi:hypothetical protein